MVCGRIIISDLDCAYYQNEENSVYPSWAAAPVVALTSLIMLIGIMIPFTPAEYLKMQPLPLAIFLISSEF
jgi:hypothetical protein